MATYLTNTTDLTAVADAIRARGNTSAPLTFPSGFANAIDAIPTGVYTITPNVTNGTWSGATAIPQGQGTNVVAKLLITPDSGCTLPDTVNVANASHTYNSATGEVAVHTPTGNVSITAACKALYNITVTCTNATASSSNPTTIVTGGTATLVFTFDGTNYTCPTTAPVVTGATGAWTKDSDLQGTMVLSNPTGNVSFTVAGKSSRVTDLTGTTWRFKEDGITSINQTIPSIYFATSGGRSYSSMDISNDGTATYLYYGGDLVYQTEYYPWWSDRGYAADGTITFSGGTYARSSWFINWIYANATLIP